MSLFECNNTNNADASIEEIRVQVLDMARNVETQAKGTFIGYINVGNLPKVKADAYIKEFQNQLPKGAVDVVIPVRNENTEVRIEFLPGRPSVDEVLLTAQKMLHFVESGSIDAYDPLDFIEEKDGDS